MENPIIQPVTGYGRDALGRILPEVKERILLQLEGYLEMKKSGKVNISELARMFSVSQSTMKSYLEEIADNWRIQDRLNLFLLHERIFNQIGDLFSQEIEKSKNQGGEVSLEIREKNSDEIVSLFHALALLNNEIESGARPDCLDIIACHFGDVATLTYRQLQKLRKMVKKAKSGT